MITIEDSIFEKNKGDKWGGAVFHNSGNMTLHRCQFLSNYADHGGGIGFRALGNRLTMKDCTFRDNIAYAQGGAINIEQGSFTIEGLICEGNLAKSEGGCLFDGDGSLVCEAQGNYITDSVFKENSAQQGGGLYVHGCRLNMQSSVITNNTASQTGGGIIIDISSGSHNLWNISLHANEAGDYGGAMTITGGDITIDECVFDQNKAMSSGGGLYLIHAPQWGMDVSLSNSKFIYNQAEDGGAITVSSSADASYFAWTSPAILSVSQTRLSYNYASDDGGAINVQLGTVKMQGSQISANHAQSSGGGLYIHQGWLRDNGSNFVQNNASIGGGIGCDVSSIQLSNTTFTENNADNGGAMWVQLCPAHSFKAVHFTRNIATYSGGALFIDDTGVCNVCKEEEGDSCSYVNNQAAFGNDTGTSPQDLQVTYLTDISSELNQKDTISLKGTLFDAYGHVATMLPGTTVLAASVASADVELQGNYRSTFSQGVAYLSFFIVPGQHIHHKNKQAALTVNVATNTYGLNQTFTIHFSNRVKTPNSVIVGINSALGAIGILSIIVTSALMWWYRDTPVIRGGTPVFLAVTLFGCLLLSISIILFPFMPQNAPCQLLAWMTHFAFVYIFAPITGKTWRIYMIFYTAKRNLQQFNFTTWKLSLFFLCVPSLLILAYLLTWTFVQTSWTVWLVQKNGEHQSDCSLDSTFVSISLTCAGLILLWLIRLAIGVKDVPKNFNESFWLGASIYTLALIMLFMGPIAVISSISTEVKQVLAGVASWIALESVILFLFWTKYYIIWFHAEEMQKHAETDESTASSEQTIIQNTTSMASTKNIIHASSTYLQTDSMT
ncbi:hypothetical protein RFI_11702 [Reticulomyxa filosa]|uniref:G-protein coupled receptors family 3 profile domain-containing protein n=1 Tax=Reticulomyxa filosa TaxID=46433 RepID=X6NIA5_RETFI|nr:hypothetical protein RFI_11702 [Reticulomyxa filosa]|eukprot:ETO25434.1 hypothetical protein RFI_11702 [Reticulomyxa filosa]